MWRNVSSILPVVTSHVHVSESVNAQKNSQDACKDCPPSLRANRRGHDLVELETVPALLDRRP